MGNTRRQYRCCWRIPYGKLAAVGVAYVLNARMASAAPKVRLRRVAEFAAAKFGYAMGGGTAGA